MPAGQLWLRTAKKLSVVRQFHSSALPLAVLTVKYSAADPKDMAITHLAISLPVEVSPRTVDSPRTSSLVVPPSEEGEGEAPVAGDEEGDGLGLCEGLGLGLDDGEGDGEGVASWARVTLADKTSKPNPAIKPAIDFLICMLKTRLDK